MSPLHSFAVYCVAVHKLLVAFHQKYQPFWNYHSSRELGFLDPRRSERVARCPSVSSPESNQTTTTFLDFKATRPIPISVSSRSRPPEGIKRVGHPDSIRNVECCHGMQMGTILRRFFVAELFPRFCLFYCQNHFSVVAKARWTNTCHFSKVPERQEMNNPFFRRQGVPYLGTRFIRIYTISFWLRCWQFWGNYMNSRTPFRADATGSSKKVNVCLLEERAESRKIGILKMRTAVFLEIVDFLWNFFWI